MKEMLSKPGFKKVGSLMMVLALCLCMSLSVFASAGTNVAITSDMLEPILDAITSNIGVILPIGVSILGIMIGIALVPALLKKFSRS